MEYKLNNEPRKEEKVLTIKIDFYPHEEELLKKLNEQYSIPKYIKDLIKKDIQH